MTADMIRTHAHSQPCPRRAEVVRLLNIELLDGDRLTIAHVPCAARRPSFLAEYTLRRGADALATQLVDMKPSQPITPIGEVSGQLYRFDQDGNFWSAALAPFGSLWASAGTYRWDAGAQRFVSLANSLRG